MFDLAAFLHKTIDAIEEMSVEEFQYWCGYRRILNDRQNNRLGLPSN